MGEVSPGSQAGLSGLRGVRRLLCIQNRLETSMLTPLVFDYYNSRSQESARLPLPSGTSLPRNEVHGLGCAINAVQGQ
jgi:hypothetical protein